MTHMDGQRLEASLRFLVMMTRTFIKESSISLQLLQREVGRANNSGADLEKLNFLMKTAMRSFFALIDAQTFTMRHAVLESASEVGLELDNKERAKLAEKRYDSAGDCVTTEDKRVGFARRLKMAYRYFPRLFDVEYHLDAGTEDFRGFKNVLLRERNLFTHPTRLEDLTPVGSWEALKPTILWFFTESHRLLDLCGDSVGLSIDTVEVEWSRFRDRQLDDVQMPTDIFDSGFYDQVSQSTGRSLAYIRHMQKGLGSDTSMAISLASQFKNSSQDKKQFGRRNLLRTFFSEVEGTLGFLRFFIERAVERGGVSDTQDIQNALGRSEFSPDQVVQVFELFSQLFGSCEAVDKTGDGWTKFVAAADIRDHVTHPRSLNELKVTNQQFATAIAGLQWYRTASSVLQVDAERLIEQARLAGESCLAGEC